MDKVRIEQIYYNRTTRRVSLRDEIDIPEITEGTNALIIDGAVHSGTSMRAAYSEVARRGASEIVSYTFVLKKTSCFIPNYFGVLIDEHDRPYFQLQSIPNNLLREQPPFASLRRISADDVTSQPRFIDTNVDSISRTSIGDLWYSDQTEGSIVYVYEHRNVIIGYISFRVSDAVLYVELIAIDDSCRGKGLGGPLMRWAVSYARATCCTSMRLRAHSERIGFYERLGFQQTGESITISGRERYLTMERKIIYHGNPAKLAD